MATACDTNLSRVAEGMQKCVTGVMHLMVKLTDGNKRHEVHRMCECYTTNRHHAKRAGGGHACDNQTADGHPRLGAYTVGHHCQSDGEHTRTNTHNYDHDTGYLKRAVEFFL